MELAVDLAGDHLGLANGELETLAAHHLHQHGELELAPTLDLPHIGPVGVRHPERHVADQFRLQPGLDQAGRELVPIGARERRGVHADGHGQGGLIHGDDGQGAGVLEIGEGLADGHRVDTGDTDDLSWAGFVDLDAVQSLGHREGSDFGRGDRPVGPAPGNVSGSA